MRRIGVAIVALAMVVATPAVLSAQASIGIGAQLLSFGGDDFEGTDAGFGGEARVMFPVGTGVMVGGGAQYSSHGLDGAANNVKVLGVLGEARYLFTVTTGKATPYIGGRVGWTRAGLSEDLDGDGTDEDLEQSGWAFGAGGGLLVAVSPTMSLDFGLILHSVQLGDTDLNGTTIPDSESSGTAFQFRAGISFKLGGSR